MDVAAMEVSFRARVVPGGSVKPLDASAAAGRSNATAGVYGARLRLWFPILLFLLVLAAYAWRRGGDVNWYELCWACGAFAQAAIRWPHVTANRGNQVDVSRVGRTEQWLMFVVFMTLLCLPMLSLATPWLDRFAYVVPPAGQGLGAVLLAVSLWLFYRSHADLGRQWSPSLEVHSEHLLVTQGVYRRMRHPMYASIWLFALAQPLLVHNWVAGALAVPGFALLYFVRVPREEQLMLDTFGDAYRQYMARTGRVWPARGA
jgi:protein-S-isoprenylcysteine O-methyltransferase Ste14